MTDTTLYSQVQKPGRYLGCEYNSCHKKWQEAKLHCALVFPDLYEIGMSHQGLQILYHIINNQNGVLAERCYCPDLDLEKILRAEDTALSTLESGRALHEFDLLGITLPYELCYTNILTVLDLAKIPLMAAEREEEHPLVIGGGACALNPEPVADFFDAILLGDGEEAIVDITTLLISAKEQNEPREQTLKRLAGCQGVYLPNTFQPRYETSGKLQTIEAQQNMPSAVQRRVLADLEAADHLLRPIVPNAKIVHDRLGVEVARGCTRGCRFCQAGMTYRPVRERRPEQIVELARQGIDNSGFEELALLSLSTGDYSCLTTVLPSLMEKFTDEHVSVAMPSMRVGTLTPEIMEQIKRVRKTGFTLAPEAGSERLRRVINKGISEEDLLNTCRTAFALGWRVIKLYFMIGLPSETEQDIEEIVTLVEKIKREITGVGRGKKQITVSIGTFVPKPHTPFQWHRQLTIAESRAKIDYLKKNLPRKSCSMKWHSPEQSYLEGVFSRGDRKLAALIHQAWLLGARLDGWSDHFNLRRWQQAAGNVGINLDDYLRPRELDETLPWQHLQSGVSADFLADELNDGLSEVYTPDCRYHGCQQCGLCDFETIRPIVHGPPPAEQPDSYEVTEDSWQRRPDQSTDDQPHYRYLVNYSRIGNICYLGHLEILQLIFRAIRRTGVPIRFSQGFNPSPKISFGPALPVGTASKAEYFLMDLGQQLEDPEVTSKELSDKLPPGLAVTSISKHPGKLPQVIECSYTVEIERTLTPEEMQRPEQFMAAKELVISRERKGKKRQLNIRPLFSACKLTGNSKLELKIISKSGAPGIKPSVALQHILGIDESEALRARITKTGWCESGKG